MTATASPPAARARAAPTAGARRDRLGAALASPALLAAILALGLALRVARVLAGVGTSAGAPLVDARFYDAWAAALAAGGAPTPGLFPADPLYPYLLGGLYRLAGHRPLVAALAQACLSTATAWLGAGIARRLAGPAAGAVAALALALYRPDVFFCGELDKTTLSAFLAAATVWLALRPGWRSRLAAGVAAGLGALTRGQLLAVLPALALLALLDPGPEPAARAWPARWRAAVALLAGGALVLAPVLARNRLAGGEWTLTALGGGWAFYAANNPANRGGTYEPPFDVGEDPGEIAEGSRALASARAGRPLSSGEASRAWELEALRWIAARPADALRGLGRRALLLSRGWEVPDVEDLDVVARWLWPLRLPLAGWGLLLPAAAVGALAAARRRDGRVVLGWLAAYLGAVAAFHVSTRFRLPAVPATAALAALGLRWTAERLRGRDLRALAGAGLAAAAAAALAASPRPAGVNRRARAGTLLNLADAERRAGPAGAARALPLLREAAALLPGDPEVLHRRGLALLEAGRTEEAEAALRAAALARPTPRDAWLDLACLLAATHRDAEAAWALGRQLELAPLDAPRARARVAAARAAAAAP